LRRARDGFNGRGRQKRRMNGATRLDWRMDGFQRIQQIIAILAFVITEVEEERLQEGRPRQRG